MLERLNESEIEFMESYYDPICLAECLFSSYDNLALMEEDKLAELRFGQFPLLSFEYILDEDPSISEKENFQLRKGAGDIYCYGGRLFGKTLCVEKIDLCLSFCCLENERCGFSSYDQLHIEGVLEEVFQAVEHHPFLRALEGHPKRSPYQVTFPNGYSLIAINMNVTGKKPGAQFFQKHFTRLYIEEASFETEEVYNKRRDSVSENGCVFRIAGMTNFTKYSPSGRQFYDLTKAVVNLPQVINPKWDAKEKAKAIKDYGGENSVNYRVFVLGRVVEEGLSVFDMERVRQNYTDRILKHFEVTKERFPLFKSILIVERPTNAEALYICADIGETAPTEIAIFSEIRVQDKPTKYKYLYNITLYNLTDKEQLEVFKYLAETCRANYVSLDCTEGTGRAIFRGLGELYPKEHLVWVAFNEKIAIDFEKDAGGNVVFDNGIPVYKEEFISEWSVKRLRDLLYDERMELPLDHKLDSQLNSVIVMQSGTRLVYSCVSEEDHLFAAFRCFSIAQWLKEFASLRPITKKTFCKTGV